MDPMSKASPAKTTTSRTKAAAVTPSVSPEKAKEEKAKDHYNLRIPRLNFKDGSLNLYLVLVLVIFAFLLGMLTNKVLYLEDQVKKGANANTAEQANGQDTLPEQAAPPQVVDVESGHLPILGNKDAKVTIVAFSDLQCPFCKRYLDETHEQLKETYIDTGKAKFAFRHYPLTSIHPNAQIASEASECANEQGKFWEYHDKVFAEQETWSPLTLTDVTNSLVSYAGDLGLNTDQFRSCVEGEKYKDKVNEDLEAGNQVQVDGTPAFFVNGYRLVGAQPFSEFERVIEEELKK
jgi:protein-disulfide isomerase